jgi:putative copper export protein
MDAWFWLNVITRWLHVTCAVIGVGALMSVGLVLLPALGAQDAALREQVLQRSKRVVHMALGLGLLTGFWNFYVAIPKIQALEHRSLYQPLIGVKILLALALLGLVSPLLSSALASGNMEEGRSRGVMPLIALALLILFLSAILRRLWV